MQAIILAGGFGTRLGDLTKFVPKPMLPIDGVPWLHRLVVDLSLNGFTDITIATHYKSEVIESYFKDTIIENTTIRCVKEHQPLGTGGAIRNCIKHVKDAHVLIVNADVLSDVDYKAMYRRHTVRNDDVTIAVKDMKDVSAFGVAVINGFHIKEFVEKPQGEPPSHFINTGVYVIRTSLLKKIPKRKEVSIEREFFPSMIEKGKEVNAYFYIGAWIDFGTVDNYLKVCNAHDWRTV